jgi:hypothetical protein
MPTNAGSPSTLVQEQMDLVQKLAERTQASSPSGNK